MTSSLLDILFPKFCLGCHEEGNYLCQDCASMIEIMEYLYCPGCLQKTISGIVCDKCKKFLKLDGLYFASSYQDFLVKELISKFKYEPLIKELSRPLAFLIITHFSIIGKPNFSDFVMIPVPLEKARLKWRGFNQAEEIAKELAILFKIKLISNTLIKIKKTISQVDLSEEKRKENIKGVFLVKNKGEIFNKKVLLVDDVYTTGSTMNECARVLKEAGAERVWGITVARG